MALANMGFKDQNWSHFGESSKTDGRSRKEEEEEEEEEKKRKRRSSKKVWKLTLIMDSMRLCMNFHAWLVSSLSPNLGF